jgi:phosphatidylinositol glycan class B
MSVKTLLDLAVRRRLLILLALAALPRLWFAWAEHGINHPDEIFQTLEPAHRFVYGFGIQSWEFRDGARSCFLPGVLALLWKCLAALGLSDPLTVVPLLRMPFVALAVYGVYLAWRVGTRLAGERAGDLAALLAAFAPLSLLLDFRTTTEAASAPVVLLALLALIEGRIVGAGAWFALLVFLRPTNVILALTALACLLLARKFRDSGRLAMGALPVTLAGGLLDWITWGSPFHHLIEYVRFNWAESGAASFGVEGPWEYGRILLANAPLITLLLVPATVGLVRKSREAMAPLVVAWLYLIFHSAIGHKEPRFLLPVLPLLAALSAAGVVAMISPWLGKRTLAPGTRVSIATVGGAAVCLFGLLYTLRLTYADLRPSGMEPQDRVLFGERDAVNRLLADAGKRPDLCGLLLLGVLPNELYSGGLTYLNRDVFLASNPPTDEAWRYFAQAANYAIAPANLTPPAWQPVTQRADAVLVSRPGGCIAVPESARPRYGR